jgi:hypothetical protein
MKCPCGFDPSIQRITVGGVQVGVAGLEDIFRSWLADGKKAKDLPKEQVLKAVRKHNYIIPRLEEEYAEAIKARYAAYCEKSPPR